MTDSPQPPAPTCTRCGRIYLEGLHGLCSACRQSDRRPQRTRTYHKHRRTHLTCDCGRPAVNVLFVHVGRESDGFQTVRMPLCRSCLRLEQAMWDEQDHHSRA